MFRRKIYHENSRSHTSQNGEFLANRLQINEGIMSNYAMTSKVEGFYRSIFEDLSVDREEAQELVDFFDESNPPPDTLVWLRSSAFRIGCEFLSDSNDNNVAILKAINAIVHAIESSRMK